MRTLNFIIISLWLLANDNDKNLSTAKSHSVTGREIVEMVVKFHDDCWLLLQELRHIDIHTSLSQNEKKS